MVLRLPQSYCAEQQDEPDGASRRTLSPAFGEKVSLVGAVPVAQYRLLIDWIWPASPAA